MPYLQRRNPTIKLGAVVVAALPLTFVFDPVTPLVLFLVTLAVGRLLGGLPLKVQLRPLAVFVLAGIAILLANIFFNKQNATSEVVFSIGPVEVTRAALWAASSLWLRLLCFALLSLVFVRTTEPQHLLLSLVHQLHLSDRVAYGVMVGYRMLPVFQADYAIIRAAQRLRGLRAGKRLSPSVLADQALCPAPVDRSGPSRGPDRDRHGCARVRRSAQAHVPREDGGHLGRLVVPGPSRRAGGPYRDRDVVVGHGALHGELSGVGGLSPAVQARATICRSGSPIAPRPNARP